MFRSRFSLFDGILLSSVLCLALLLLLLPLLWQTHGTELLLSTPTSTQSLSLSKDQTLTVTSLDCTLTVEILDGRARVLESSCPDGVCVASGWISKDGDCVICAPAGVRLLVADQKGGANDVDFVAG